MGEVGAMAVPLRICGKRHGRRQQPDPEDGQFETKMASIGGLQVAGIVPPLCAETLMSTQVFGEMQRTRAIHQGKASRGFR